MILCMFVFLSRRLLFGELFRRCARNCCLPAVSCGRSRRAFYTRLEGFSARLCGAGLAACAQSRVALNSRRLARASQRRRTTTSSDSAESSVSARHSHVAQPPTLQPPL